MRQASVKPALRKVVKAVASMTPEELADRALGTGGELAPALRQLAAPGEAAAAPAGAGAPLLLLLGRAGKEAPRLPEPASNVERIQNVRWAGGGRPAARACIPRTCFAPATLLRAAVLATAGQRCCMRHLQLARHCGVSRDIEGARRRGFVAPSGIGRGQEVVGGRGERGWGFGAVRMVRRQP